jgi:heme-degrading monooxygenase HmoA
MYVRLARFTLGPDSEAKAQTIADEVAPLISVQPGCRDVTVFGDHAEGEYGIIVLWDSQDNADTAAGVVRPKLNEHLQVTPMPRLRHGCSR